MQICLAARDQAAPLQHGRAFSSDEDDDGPTQSRWTQTRTAAVEELLKKRNERIELKRQQQLEQEREAHVQRHQESAAQVRSLQPQLDADAQQRERKVVDEWLQSGPPITELQVIVPQHLGEALRAIDSSADTAPGDVFDRLNRVLPKSGSLPGMAMQPIFARGDSPLSVVAHACSCK